MISTPNGFPSHCWSPCAAETFEGFDTTVLELKTVFSMTATAGRTRHISCFAVTGNGAGLVGFGLGKGNTGMAAIKQCKRRAAQRLIYVERCDGHTGTWLRGTHRYVAAADTPVRGCGGRWWTQAREAGGHQRALTAFGEQCRRYIAA